MTARSNTAEGSPGAVALVGGSGGNTGGTSGDFANTVSSGTGTTQAFDNSRSMHGTWSYTFATGGTSASASFNWTGIAGMALCTGRCYINASAFVGIGSLVRLRGATVQTGRIAISATGQVQIRDTTNGVITSTTAVLTANSWARIEWAINVGASATADVWLYLTPDAPIGSHTETLHVTAQNFGTNNVDEVGFGFPSAVANGSQIWMDDFWVSDAGVPGPSQLWTPQPAVFIMPMPLYRLPSLVLVAAPQAAVVQPSVSTPSPLVVTPQAVVPQRPPQPTLVRSSLADAVVSTVTPSPLVISQPAAWTATSRPVLVRSSIQDFATPVTRGPLVVTQQTVTVRPQPAMLVRSSIQDFATPVGTQPLVATSQTQPVRPAATVLIRSTLADPVVPAAAGVQPLIVTMRYRTPAPQQAILVRSNGSSDTCTVTRPNTGTVVRPATGTVSRPSTGSVVRPGTGTVTRPNTGLVVRPGCH